VEGNGVRKRVGNGNGKVNGSSNGVSM
jgi:hypothetical protein